LGGIALRPFPFLLQLVRELIRILHALDIAARARIAVPVPGAADPASGLEHPCREAEAAKPVQHVHAREPRADDDHVEVDRAARVPLAFRFRHASSRSTWRFVSLYSPDRPLYPSPDSGSSSSESRRRTPHSASASSMSASTKCRAVSAS